MDAQPCMEHIAGSQQYRVLEETQVDVAVVYATQEQKRNNSYYLLR
jgi:hypothetical protein